MLRARNTLLTEIWNLKSSLRRPRQHGPSRNLLCFEPEEELGEWGGGFADEEKAVGS